MSILLSELIEKRRKLPPIDRNSVRSTLAERFLLPPFTVLDARQGYWQKRKKAWLSLGGNTELDHGSNLLDMSASAAGLTDPKEIAEWNLKRRKKVKGLGAIPTSGAAQDINTFHKQRSAKKVGDIQGNGLLGISQQARSHYKETQPQVFNEKTLNNIGKTQGGTSVFDPVLCEAMYRWFCPRGGKVLDPFAGGDMQGIVAGCIGRSYYGVDLREKQVEANRRRKDEICPDSDVRWEVGDSHSLCKILPYQFDFILSNPPYADLERYSNDPRDLSTMEYEDFLEKYRDIVNSCCYMLKNNRFAFFLVGEIRDKITGNYRNFVGDTVQAFLDCGLHLYNEAILVTSVGSLPIRVGSMFKSGRKLGKTHQNVLIFLKGDAELACLECGEVDIDDLDMPECKVGKIAIEEEPNIVISTDISLIACLSCDINRSEAVLNNGTIPRTWIGTVDGWKRLEDLVELTYVVNGVAYLNREVFPDAPVPAIDRLPVRTLRRGGNGA